MRPYNLTPEIRERFSNALGVTYTDHFNVLRTIRDEKELIQVRLYPNTTLKKENIPATFEGFDVVAEDYPAPTPMFTPDAFIFEQMTWRGIKEGLSDLSEEDLDRVPNIFMHSTNKFHRITGYDLTDEGRMWLHADAEELDQLFGEIYE